MYKNSAEATKIISYISNLLCMCRIFFFFFHLKVVAHFCYAVLVVHGFPLATGGVGSTPVYLVNKVEPQTYKTTHPPTQSTFSFWTSQNVSETLLGKYIII